jgi:hypothetical protein
MIKPYPRYTSEDYRAYDFYTGERLNYKTTIIIDELNDNLLIMPWHIIDVSETSFCKCNDFSYRQRACKHIKECLEYLRSVGIDYRTDTKPEKDKDGCATKD